MQIVITQVHHGLHWILEFLYVMNAQVKRILIKFYDGIGFHRKMGPKISRVRSLQLDIWTKENLEIIRNVGNIKANNYWENSLGKEEKVDLINSEEKKQNFIADKYVNKRYIPKEMNIMNPVQQFLLNKKEGKIDENLSNVKKNSKNFANFSIKNRNVTPEPTKSISFDWDQAAKIVVNKSEKQKWKNFDKEFVIQNIQKNHSNQNLRVNPKSETLSETKNEKFEDFQNFKAVSIEFRKFLLSGNPLERLKTSDK